MNKKQKILAIFTLSLVLFLLLGNIGKIQAAQTQTQTQTSQTQTQTKTQQAGNQPSQDKPWWQQGWDLITGAGGTVVGWIGAGAIGGIFYFIGLLVGGVAALATMIAGWLTNFAVSLNFGVLNNPLIDVGWRISRDLANLGFVLFIIVIAIATILRFQEYGVKNTLGKLIAVALLVNFSLVFAGVFVDFSNMLTNFFTKNIAGSNFSDLGAALIAPFGVQSLLQVKDTETSMQQATQNATTPGGFINHTVSLLIIAGLTFLAAFCLFAFGIMLLIRFISLTILLVVVPLACLFWILPATRKIWDQWLNQFMKWIIFAPVASFFLYLGVYLMNNYQNWIGGQAQSAQAIGSVNLIPESSLTIKDLYIKIANLIITGGFMIGGLIAANSYGIHGAKNFLGMTQAAGKWARGAIGGLAAGGAQRFTMGGGKTTTNAAGQTEFTTRGQRIATAISRVPGFQGVAQRISAFSSPQARAANVETYRKNNLVNLSNDALIRQMTVPGAFTNRTAAAAMVQDATRRNLTGDARITPLLNRYLQTAQSMGNINTVLNNRPDLAPVVGQTVQQVMQRIRADKADEISHDSLGQLDVVLSLDNSKIRRIGTVGEQRQKVAIENAINNAITNIHLLTLPQQATLNHVEAQIRTLQAGGNW